MLWHPSVNGFAQFLADTHKQENSEEGEFAISAAWRIELVESLRKGNSYSNPIGFNA